MKDSQGIELKIGQTVVSSDPCDVGMTFKVVGIDYHYKYVSLIEIKRDWKEARKLPSGGDLPFPFKPTRNAHQMTVIDITKTRDEKLTARTIKLIERGRHIVLKRPDGWYLQCHTNIAAGPDKASWGKRPVALEIFNLKWAFAIAPLYDCKVFSISHKEKSKP